MTLQQCRWPKPMAEPYSRTTGRMRHLNDLCPSFQFDVIQSHPRDATPDEMQSLPECSRCGPQNTTAEFTCPECFQRKAEVQRTDVGICRDCEP
jgi:hypothetical protein